MSKPISQREARAMRKRLREIADRERQERHAWTATWPNGVCLQSVTVDPVVYAKIETARRLGYPVVVTTSQNALYFHAVKEIEQ